MHGCVKMPGGNFSAGVPDGFSPEFHDLSLPSRFFCGEGDDFFHLVGTEEDSAAELVADAFSAVPASIRRRYLSGTVFSILGEEEFDDAKFDPGQGVPESMGIKLLGRRWKLLEKILSTEAKAGLKSRLAYALASRVAKDLEGEEGFDSRLFCAAFVRRVAGRVDGDGAGDVFERAQKGESMKRHAAFVGRLFLASRIDAESARELFRKSAAGGGHYSVAEGAALGARLGIQQPMNLKKLYQDFVDRGLQWNLPGGQGISLVMQSASTRERPESSHRFYLYYSSGALDGFLESGAKAVLPGAEPWISFTPGVVGSYDTKTPAGDKRAVILAGSLFDAGVTVGPGEIVLHSYLGLPVTVMGAGASKKDFSPEWEFGIQFRGFKNRLFVGAMASVSVLDPSTGYYGFVLRIDG